MAKIDFSKIEEMISSSLDFSLTEAQYKKLTGREMPKDASYLIRKSALATFAQMQGLDIVLHERAISFKPKSL